MPKELLQISVDNLTPETELPIVFPTDGLINQLITQVHQGEVGPEEAAGRVWREFYAGSFTQQQLKDGLNTLVESFPENVRLQLETVGPYQKTPLMRIAQRERLDAEERKWIQEAKAQKEEEKPKKKRKPKSVRIYERRTKAQARGKGQIYP